MYILQQTCGHNLPITWPQFIIKNVLDAIKSRIILTTLTSKKYTIGPSLDGPP